MPVGFVPPPKAARAEAAVVDGVAAGSEGEGSAIAPAPSAGPTDGASCVALFGAKAREALEQVAAVDGAAARSEMVSFKVSVGAGRGDGGETSTKWDDVGDPGVVIMFVTMVTSSEPSTASTGASDGDGGGEAGVADEDAGGRILVALIRNGRAPEHKEFRLVAFRVVVATFVPGAAFCCGCRRVLFLRARST